MLLIVKLKMDVAPFTIGSDTKDLAIVGAGAGMAQPEKVMSSRLRSAPEASVFAFQP